MSFQRPLKTSDRGKARLAQARQLGYDDALACHKLFAGYFLEPTDEAERRAYLTSYRRGEARRSELRA